MLDAGGGALDIEIRKGVRPALVADEQRIALRVIARAARILRNLHQAAIRVLAVPGRNALRHNRALRIASQMNHLGAGVRLLPVVRRRHRIELADGVIALKNAPGVLPRDGGSGLDLRPGDLGIYAKALAALRDEEIGRAHV